MDRKNEGFKMKRIGIRTKMLLGILLPVVLVLALAAGLIISSVSNVVQQLNTTKLASDSLAISNEVNSFLSGYLIAINQVTTNGQMEQIIKTTSPGTPLPQSPLYPEVKRALDKSTATDSHNILATWVGDFDSSQVTQSDGFTSAPGWDITARPWYNVKTTKLPMMTEPYVDVSTGKLIVSAAAPVFDSTTQEVIGACGFDIQLDTFCQTMAEHKLGQGGFMVLFTPDNQIVYHPDSNLLQKQAEDANLSDNIRSVVDAGTEGSYEYTMSGVSYYGSLSQVGTTGWKVLTALPSAEVMAACYAVVRSLATIFALGLLIIVLAVLAISKGITRPLKKLAKAAQQIADGQLDVQVDVRSHDETGRVAAAISKTVERLRGYMDYIDEITRVLTGIAEGELSFELQHDYAGDFAKIKESLLLIRGTLTHTLQGITEAAEQVNQNSAQVSSSSQNLAQGVTEQASSLEELSATLTDITAQVQSSSSFARQANVKAQEAGGQLEESNRDMTELLSAIHTISDTAGKIGNIIKTIEDIAFQTNILALNAAVEAARAGDAGKGFSVVAGEVRSLAAKSAEAAKNTTALIEESLRAVENGTHIADSTARSLVQVVGGAQAIATAISEISEASSKQSGALEQVKQGVEQISAVVLTNSATAQQSAAASEELSSQAQTLHRLVSGFHLDTTVQRSALAALGMQK